VDKHSTDDERRDEADVTTRWFSWNAAIVVAPDDDSKKDDSLRDSNAVDDGINATENNSWFSHVTGYFAVHK